MIDFYRQFSIASTLSTHTRIPDSTTNAAAPRAFSNVGADNLAQALQRLGLKVVRVGRASAVDQSLWDCTMDAAIDRDVQAQEALQNAAKTTALLTRFRQNKRRRQRQQGHGTTTTTTTATNNSQEERSIRQAATAAVQPSIQACTNRHAISTLDANQNPSTRCHDSLDCPLVVGR